MGWAAGDDAGDIVPGFVADQNPVGRNVAGNPSPQGDKVDGPVGMDIVDHEANLIAVSLQHDNRLAPRVLRPVEVEIAEAVLRKRGIGRAVPAGHLQHLILKAGGAPGIGKVGDHAERMLLLHLH